MTKRILILSANPKGTSALDLEIEKRDIRDALRGSDFTLETRGGSQSRNFAVSFARS